jgi:hypothetical protein
MEKKERLDVELFEKLSDILEKLNVEKRNKDLLIDSLKLFSSSNGDVPERDETGAIKKDVNEKVITTNESVYSTMQPIVYKDNLTIEPKYEILFGTQKFLEGKILEKLKLSLKDPNNSKLSNEEQYIKDNFDLVTTIYQIQEAYEKSLEPGFKNCKFSINIEPELMVNENFLELLDTLGKNEPYKSFLKKVEFEILEKIYVSKTKMEI